MKMSQIKCPNCNTLNDSSRQDCHSCAAQLPQPLETSQLETLKSVTSASTSNSNQRRIGFWGTALAVATGGGILISGVMVAGVINAKIAADHAAQEYDRLTALCQSDSNSSISAEACVSRCEYIRTDPYYQECKIRGELDKNAKYTSKTLEDLRRSWEPSNK
jgi:hypothetical protein